MEAGDPSCVQNSSSNESTTEKNEVSADSNNTRSSIQDSNNEIESYHSNSSSRSSEVDDETTVATESRRGDKPAAIAMTGGSPLKKPTLGFSSILKPSKISVEAGAIASSDSKSKDASNSSGVASFSFVPLEKKTQEVGKGKDSSDPSFPGNNNSQQPQFTFGENLSERVIKKETKSEEKEDKSLEDSSSRKRKAEEEKSDKPAEDDNTANLSAPTTGEEDEENVLHIPCKLYKFEDNNWVELVTRGQLRLNDNIRSGTSRLIVRMEKSLRVMLNTNVYPGMVFERPNDNCIKVSGSQQHGDQSVVKLFLIKPTKPMDTDTLYSLLRERRNRKAWFMIQADLKNSNNKKPRKSE